MIKRSHVVVHRTSAILLATTMLCTSGAAFAQQAEAKSGEDVIVVTANKREQNLQDVASAITALGNEKLDQLQVNELQDIVKFLPSVTVYATAPGFNQVYFRGVASGENANHSASLPTVGTYLDEMPITTIQGALDIHAYDLSRVEALAGPQGTLYGASSMAGTIKIVSNAPDYSSTYGAVDLELNSIARGDVGGIAEGFINAKLTDRAALRVVAWYRHDGGYIDNVAGSRTYPSSGIVQDNDEFVEDNYNDVDTYGARAALGIELDDSWTLRPTIMGQIQKFNGSFAQEHSSAVSRSLQTVQYNPEKGKDKWLQAAMTIEGKIGNWDLVATGGHLRRKDHIQSDYSDYAYFYDALYQYGEYFVDNDGVKVSPNQYIQGQDTYRRNFAELRLSSPQDAPFRVIGGLFYQRQKHLIEQNYIIDNIADAIKVPGTESDIWLTKQRRVDRDYAAFGEASFDITDKLTATAGGRYYKYNNSLIGFFGYNYPGYSDNTDYACIGPVTVAGSPCTNLGVASGDSVIPKRAKKTGFIPKGNLTYKFNDDILVYTTYSRGFRPGGINRRGSLPPYGPDKLNNYEIGWKTTIGPIRFNGAVYQQNWKSVQLSILGANGLSQIQNAGDARVRGFEADIGYRTGGLSLNSAISFNDSKLTFPFCNQISDSKTCATPEGNSILAPVGSRLPVTARFKGNAVARYEFPIDTMDGHVQMAFNYIGKRRSDLRPAINDLVGNYPAYATLDLSVGVKRDKWRAELFATNLFDRRGINNSSVQCLQTTCGDPDDVSNTGGVFYDNVIKPRLIGLKVGTDF